MTAILASPWLPAVISAFAALVVVVIQSRNGFAIERLRDQLSQVANQRASILERRADAIQDIYAKLVDAHEA